MPWTIIVICRHTFIAKKDPVSTVVDNNVQVTCPLAVKAFKIVRLVYRKEKNRIFLINVIVSQTY